MGNKTAIQSLLDLIEEGSLDSLYQVKQHLKNISLNEEKQQIIKAYEVGDIYAIERSGKKYYNSTYGKATEN